MTVFCTKHMKHYSDKALVKEVMLVDDEPIDLFICEKLLSALRFAEQFVPMPDSMKALDFLEKRIKSGEALPQIVFLDYFMPLVDGQDFLERIKLMEADYPGAFDQTRFIVLTSLKAPEKRKSLAVYEHVFKVMSKPLNEKSVMELSSLLLQQVS